MLYERWRQVCREHRGEPALREVSTGRSWSFDQLDAAANARSDHSGPIAFPTGAGGDFILETLAAWRRQAVLCPLETGSSPLAASTLPLPSEIAHLKLTSATTGQARLVAFTADQLAADAANIVSTMGLRPDWPNIGVISMAHSYGFSNLVLPLLLHGIPLILLASTLPESLRRAVAEAAEVTLPAVPALWRAWHEAAALTPGIRLAISAGAPLPLTLERDVFARGGLKLHNFYGATECGGIAYDRTVRPRNDEACIGAPMDNVELSIGDNGCLEVRGAAVGTAYWPERTENLGGGRFLTSDLAEIKEGAVFLRGRAGEQINVAGRKVSPETIERALLDHEGVPECLVFGVPGADADRGDLIVACVVSKGDLDAAALKQFLLSCLPAWQVPKEWHFVESLEPNQRGKLSRAQWRVRLGYRRDEK
jgi:acyl-CoA synthetase (AMP-forming)/AMP-acid ligase II